MKSSWNDLTIQNTKRRVFQWEAVLRARIIQKANERK